MSGPNRRKPIWRKARNNSTLFLSTPRWRHSRPGACAKPAGVRTAGAAQPSVPETSLPVATPQGAGGAGGTEGWVVQLGSFSNQKNADELSEKLQKMAYHVFVEQITQDGQTVYRVRIGPQRQRSDADTIRDRLARELQLKAMVMHFP